MHALDGAFAIFAFTVITGSYVLPAFLRRAGASDTLIGLIAAITTVCTIFTPLLGVHLSQNMQLKKKYVMGIGIPMRMHMFFVAAAALLILPHSATAFFVVYTILSIVNTASNKLAISAWLEMIGKTTPVRVRGMLWSARNSLGLIAAIILGSQVRRLLDAFEYPVNYASLFVLCGASFMLNLLFLGSVRERPGRMPLYGEKPSFSNILHSIPSIFRTDRQFSLFILSQACSSLAMGLVSAFLVLTAADRLDIRLEDYMGMYMMIGLTSSLAGNVICGKFSDRVGHLPNLMLAGPLIVAGCLWAMAAPDATSYGLTFVFIGLAQATKGISSTLIVLEFAGDAKRSIYTGIHATVFAPLTTFGPLVGGLLRDGIGIYAWFASAILLALFSTFIILRYVHDPRKRTERGQQTLRSARS